MYSKRGSPDRRSLHISTFAQIVPAVGEAPHRSRIQSVESSDIRSVVEPLLSSPVSVLNDWIRLTI